MLRVKKKNLMKSIGGLSTTEGFLFCFLIFCRQFEHDNTWVTIWTLKSDGSGGHLIYIYLSLYICMALKNHNLLVTWLET